MQVHILRISKLYRVNSLLIYYLRIFVAIQNCVMMCVAGEIKRVLPACHGQPHTADGHLATRRKNVRWAGAFSHILCIAPSLTGV